MSTSTETPFLGTGRRKRATARVRLSPGSGQWSVNGRDIQSYFPTEQLQRAARAPLATIERIKEFDISARVLGGGPNGQAGAVALGIARALEKMDSELRIPLKRGGHMRRDPREKERKKSGQPGARKKFQFSKR
jgi:small subunit ribosomal protein S9